MPGEAAQALHREGCLQTQAGLLPCVVLGSQWTLSVQLLLQWYRWQVTGEPEQAQVELSEAVSLS